MMRVREKNTADKILVKYIVHGNTDVFNELITRYQKQIYSLAYRLTNDVDDAQDLAQEAFTKIYLVLGTYNDSRPFFPWMYKIATNVIYGKLRSRKFRPQEVSLHDMIDFLPCKTSAETHPEEFAISKENQFMVQQAISELDDKYRVPIVMKYLEDLSYKDISSLLDLPIKTVETRLYRAKMLLGNRLKMDIARDVRDEVAIG